MKKWKIVLLVIVLGAIVGSVVAYRMWNKPHTMIEDVKTVTVTVSDITSAFEADEAKANETYLNKAITVTGSVSETEENQDGNLVVILAGDDPMATVQCTMRDKGGDAVIGSTVTVKGFCNGSSLFGVLLSDCVLVE